MVNNNLEYSLLGNLKEILTENIESVIRREQTTFDDFTSPFSNKFVLFGAGGLGRKVLTGLRQIGIEPLAFADNNPSVWGKEIDGLQVIDPVTASNKYSESAAFIVTIWRAGGSHRFSNTRKQLNDLNCKKVVSFAALFWKYPNIFLPYYTIGVPHPLYQQAEKIIEAFKIWDDDHSRNEYLSQIRWRLLLDFDGLSSPVTHAQYFPVELFNLLPTEVFIDCGAFDGDSLRDFFNYNDNFKGEVIAIEPDPNNVQKLNNYLASLKDNLRKRVKVIQKAIGTKKEVVRFSATGSAASLIDPQGVIEVDCTTLDSILKDKKITFLKMDIEGAELDALKSAENSILDSTPILAISVYHKPDDLWTIPLYIKSLSDQYCFFLRPHNEEGWDLVTYAIPRWRLINNH
jgi:FkbM family methyltransferase